MTIELITKEEYNTLKNIYHNHKNLFLQNNGYEYLDKSKFTEEDKKAFKIVTEILSKSIKGFSEFFNFKLSKDGDIRVRFDYDWSADTLGGLPFTGVGYLELDTLLNGFEIKEPENDTN